MVRQLELDGNDRALVERVRATIDFAVQKAHQPSVVTNRIAIKFGSKGTVRQLELDVYDQALVERLLAVIDEAVQKSHMAQLRYHEGGRKNHSSKVVLMSQPSSGSTLKRCPLFGPCKIR